MAWPISINIALKEWATTIAAMESGRQIILLRKGGILEQSIKNRFSFTHNEFLFFPTHLHQSQEQLKPEVQLESLTAEPDVVQIASAGIVTDILKVASREQIDRLFDQHIWTNALIDMRFKYKPQNPLYLVLVRTYRLHEPASIANTPAYAGCKSWVPLEHAIETGNATPVLDEVKYAHHRALILKSLDQP